MDWGRTGPAPCGPSARRRPRGCCFSGNYIVSRAFRKQHARDAKMPLRLPPPPRPPPLPGSDRLLLLLGLASGWATLADRDPLPASASVLTRVLEASAVRRAPRGESATKQA